jgi:acyl carrier protein
VRSIQNELRQYIGTELGRDMSGLGDGESLLEAGVIDSMGVLELVSFIEKNYGIAVLEDEMMPENFDTVDAMAAFIERRRGAQSV